MYTGKEELIGWIPPEEYWLRLNVDGLIFQASNFASCGGLIRNSKGNFIVGFMLNLGRCSITLVELWGCGA
ncbi:hypothetical protein AHAS_Ahas18G0188800 [Arachis hypogaea]